MQIRVDDFVDRIRRIAAHNQSTLGSLRPIRVTFDDGYRDNLELAVPILMKFRQKATFFIAGNALDHSEPFWWDQIPKIVDAAPPGQLRVDCSERSFSVDISTAEGRKRASRAIEKSLRRCRRSEINSVLSNLRSQAGYEPLEGPARLSEDEIRELACLPGMSVGGHTEYHEFLSSLTPTEIQSTVEANLDWLETVTGRRPRAFAYPFGSRASVGSHAVAAVRATTVERAYVNWQGATLPWTDAYMLPRTIAM